MSSIIFHTLSDDMSSSGSKARPKKSAQIGFKVEPDKFAELETAAVNEERPPNQLARLIFDWGFARYKEAGSYDVLVKRRPFVTSVSLAEGTSKLELTSHISKPAEQAIKEKLLDTREQMGVDIIGADRPKKKARRPKAS